MNEAEARAIANIIVTADSYCDSCARDLMELLDGQFPDHDWAAHLAAADVTGNMKESNLREQLARRRARQPTNERRTTDG